MLEYLKNKQFTGDLSLEDADVLAQYASQSQSILEFGAGGSTQLMAQSSAESITSVETDANWIQLTQERLSQIPNARPVEFVEYTTQFNKEFDLILVDGVDHLRRDFAIETWKYLRVGGVMLFHDTRRFQDFQNAAWVAQLYFNEISSIDINVRASNGVSSNITVLHKKASEPYINWNDVEGKPSWAYGIPDGSDHPLWSYK
ncbi:AdoMet_MTases domain containing protein [uncultured Caudovirales phage]|uniref:AdoMet_MTases domain containing protein n=1 Tax=uncultured Caudovirales phage TaxID=2100421 RepID=A0A6J5KS99_9CAUD|nr:AdoMet_MTases domain containing protein [uncultured Caudovirales phage]CAB5208546.1 AdoMet_MTases domain containing protein [uncultured Caudovirales phage]